MTSLLGHLQESGYEPQDSGPRADGDWYDLTASGTGTIRACLSEDGADVHAFDACMFCLWSARMSPGAPDAVIIAVLEAAERQLAAARPAGPVTPAQAATS